MFFTKFILRWSLWVLLMWFLTMGSWEISGKYRYMLIKCCQMSRYVFQSPRISPYNNNIISVAGFEMILRRHISHYLITYYLPSGQDHDYLSVVHHYIVFLSIFFIPNTIFLTSVNLVGRSICGRVLDKLRCPSGCYSWTNGASYHPLPRSR